MSIEIIAPIIAVICACIIFIVKKYRSNCSYGRDTGFVFNFHSSTERQEHKESTQ